MSDIFDVEHWPGEDAWIADGQTGLQRFKCFTNEMGYTEVEAVFLVQVLSRMSAVVEETNAMREIREQAPNQAGESIDS